jgi:hypothetical protein
VQMNLGVVSLESRTDDILALKVLTLPALLTKGVHNGLDLN